MSHLIDDTLPGGPRWLEHLGHEPVWVETKSQLKRELAARGLRLRETDNYNRQDKSPWATRTRLRAGVTPDQALLDLAAQVNAPAVPVVRPRAQETLFARDVHVIHELELAVRAIGYLPALRCLRCNGTVEAHNSRLSNSWSMACPCRRMTYDGDRPHPDSGTSPAPGGGSDLGRG